MPSTVVISTKNYSGETAQITYFPDYGGTIDVGVQTLPYNYITDYFYGNYQLFFSAYNYTCEFSIPFSGTLPTPQTITATSVSYNFFERYGQDPESFPNNDLSGTSLSSLTTNIILEQNFAGTFDGGISQFRMYVSPLTAPEIKHNFKLRMADFRMFNPDCPDCSTLNCNPDDFTYNIS